MKLSKRGEYALRTLINLGMAAEAGNPLVQVSQLSVIETLPSKFLEQIMQDLKSAGYVQSQRGKFGGYRLARPAGEISIGEIVRLIDGPLAPIRCVSHTAYESCSCPDEEHCGLRMLMLDVRNAIAGILDRYSLADVVSVAVRKLQRDNLPLPFSERRPPPKVAATRRRRSARKAGARPNLSESEGVLYQLIGDYSI